MKPARIWYIRLGLAEVFTAGVTVGTSFAWPDLRPLWWSAFAVTIALSLVRGFLKVRYNLWTAGEAP